MYDICKAHIHVATSGLMKYPLHKTGKFSVSPTMEKKVLAYSFLSAYIFIYIIFIRIYCKELFNQHYRIKTDLDFRFYRKLKLNMLERNFDFQIHVQIKIQLTVNDKRHKLRKKLGITETNLNLTRYLNYNSLANSF